MRALACALLALAACGENATPVGEPPSPFAASCVPDLDGTLTAAELQLLQPPDLPDQYLPKSY